MGRQKDEKIKSDDGGRKNDWKADQRFDKTGER
jgi:hypothetical protein